MATVTQEVAFHTTSVTFLGYVISQKGVDEAKVRIVKASSSHCKGVAKVHWVRKLLAMLHCNFSSIATPLTALLTKSPKKLIWNTAADIVVNQTAFTMLLILKQHDPEQSFTVEVDASETGVGVVLSQHFSEKPKLHTVAFSRTVSPAECNYDIGNHKLLAVK